MRRSSILWFLAVALTVILSLFTSIDGGVMALPGITITAAPGVTLASAFVLCGALLVVWAVASTLAERHTADNSHRVAFTVRSTRHADSRRAPGGSAAHGSLWRAVTSHG